MNSHTPVTPPRSTFTFGEDCEATIDRQADNKGAEVDIFKFVIDNSVFYLESMRLRGSNKRWGFGSVFKDEYDFGYYPKHERKPHEVWSFGRDARISNQKFYGTVYTYGYQGVTYAVFENNDTLRFVVPLKNLLLGQPVNWSPAQYIGIKQAIAKDLSLDTDDPLPAVTSDIATESIESILPVEIVRPAARNVKPISGQREDEFQEEFFREIIMRWNMI